MNLWRLLQFWEPVRAYCCDCSPENADKLKFLLTLEGTRWQYTNGVQNLAAISLDTFLNTGHLALEECGDAIANHIRRFMTTHVA